VTAVRLRLPPRGERGSISILIAGVMAALLAIIGLAYDTGHKYQLAADANAIAQQAARAGAQALDTAALLSSGAVTLNAQEAVAAADAYLSSPAMAASRVTGSAAVTGATTLVVTVTMTRATAFLGVIGIGQQTVTATATATLLHGVTAPQ
jgi:hypothetical protein